MKSNDLKKPDDQEAAFNVAIYKKKRLLAFSLLSVFAAIYFFAAIITTTEFKELAATSIFGVPLAILIGMLVFLAGVVVTRVHLVKSNKEGR